MRLAYGLKVAAVLIAGGTAIYYATGPRLTVTAPDIVELMEGINERRAATNENAFTGNTNDGWSFTTFTNLGMTLPHADMKKIMDQQIALAPWFVRSHSSTGYVMWTAPALFQECGVGPADGTQTLYTVGFATNGTPCYSNTPWLTLPTNLLWECHRLQVKMTTTVHKVTWSSAPEYDIEGTLYGSTNQVILLEYSTGPYSSYADPPWYTNLQSVPSLVAGHTVTALDVKPDGLTNGEHRTQSKEWFKFYGYYDGSRWIEGHPWESNVYYRFAASNQVWHWQMVQCTGSVRVANLDTGVFASVSIAVAENVEVYTENYETIGQPIYKRYTNYNVWSTNWDSAITLVGVSTNPPIKAWTGDYLPRLADVMDMAALTATGVFFRTSDDTPIIEVEMKPQAVGFVNWTFTRCRP